MPLESAAVRLTCPFGETGAQRLHSCVEVHNPRRSAYTSCWGCVGKNSPSSSRCSSNCPQQADLWKPYAV